VLAGDLKAT
jgi:hypothetical protein